MRKFFVVYNIFVDAIVKFETYFSLMRIAVQIWWLWIFYYVCITCRCITVSHYLHINSTPNRLNSQCSMFFREADQIALRTCSSQIFRIQLQWIYYEDVSFIVMEKFMRTEFIRLKYKLGRACLNHGFEYYVHIDRVHVNLSLLLILRNLWFCTSLSFD